MQKLKTVIITGRLQNASAATTAKKAIVFLEKHKVKVFVDSFFPVRKQAIELNKAKADIILCFGGDGSLLDCFCRLEKSIPVMGINCGFRGSLCALTKQNWKKGIADILANGFFVEKRSRLKVFGDEEFFGTALNEVLVVPLKPGRLLKYHVIVNNQDFGIEADDGLIVATPTGSTAHAQSAGGPNIEFSAKVFAIVRLNPLDLNRRPLIVNDHKTIKISGIEQVPVSVILDGQHHFHAGKEIKITKGTNALIAKIK